MYYCSTATRLATRVHGRPSPAWRCCVRQRPWLAPNSTFRACRCAPGSRPGTARRRGNGSPGSRAAIGCAICAGTAGLPISISSVVGIEPADQPLALRTVGPASCDTVLARRVVLATGQDGGGTWKVPDMIERPMPRSVYAHSNGPIEFGRFVGKRIGILGHGGSAFDAALEALRAGAARVDICFRRPLLPVVNPHWWIGFSAFLAHYPELDDRTRWNIARHFDRRDQPPPRHTCDRACRQPGLHIHAGSAWNESIGLATRSRSQQNGTGSSSIS